MRCAGRAAARQPIRSKRTNRGATTAADGTTQALGNDSPGYSAHSHGTLGRLGESPEHGHPRRPLWLVALGGELTLGACGASDQAPALHVSARSVSATPTPNSLQEPVFWGPVGTAFTFQDATGNVMTVSLIDVMYGPQGTSDISPGIAYRWVGATFKIVGVSDTSSGVPNAEASLSRAPAT